ncbi:MAG: methyltransferase [Pseudolabrys sp.]|nr:methyltransferase [Pseudolabrys sp.]
MDEPETSIDGVLGGRLRLRQPLGGHRVGHDAILLAAATGARRGERALELGAGVGAAGLALAARVAGLQVVLVEIDGTLAALAAENARRNGLDDRVRAVACDAEDLTALASAGIAAGSADRVLMNPPFRDATRAHLSPDARRRLAHAGDPGLLGRWIAAAHALLKPGGVLTVLWHADAEARLLDALGRGFGAVALLRIHPRPGRRAIRVLARAVKGGDRSRADHAPLVLNDADGRPSAAAEAVLRGGGTLSLACP